MSQRNQINNQEKKNLKSNLMQPWLRFDQITTCDEFYNDFQQWWNKEKMKEPKDCCWDCMNVFGIHQLRISQIFFEELACLAKSSPLRRRL